MTTRHKHALNNQGVRLIITSIIATLTLVTWISCNNYESKIPISDASGSRINVCLVGKWVGLEADETRLFPQFEINLQPFNNQEYVASFKVFSGKGKSIESVDLYKVFNSTINSKEYLNIQPIGARSKDFIFYQIEADSQDSVSIRFLMDSLDVKFETSAEFSAYLAQGESQLDHQIWSKPLTFYRWHTLTWDRTNQVNKSDQFDEFYALGKIDENDFMDQTDAQLQELINGKEEIKIDKIRTYFKGIRLYNGELAFWKMPNYGVIKMRSGAFVKLKYDLRGPRIVDLTNQVEYVNTGNDGVLTAD